MSDRTERIIGHMNADHQLSLGDYLVEYAKLKSSEFDLSTVKITEVDENKLVLQYSLKVSPSALETFSLNWNEAAEGEGVDVKTLSDVKGKLVAMAKFAAANQGYASKRITKAVGPSSSVFMYPLVSCLAANAYDSSLIRNLFKREAIFQSLSKYIPQALNQFYSFYEKNAKGVFFAVIIIHIIEILAFSVPFFIKYRVPLAARIKWTAMHIFEGFYVISRTKKLEK